MTKKNRSGTTWTEADYRAKGYGTIKLRLPLETIERASMAAHEADLSRAQWLTELIEKNTPTLK